jgi:catechol 2,3-dioxygenase-like lactoylglutathione lyase family enzyme
MPNLTYIAPFFIVADLKASVSFYVDKLGFEAVDADGYILFFGRPVTQQS